MTAEQLIKRLRIRHPDLRGFHASQGFRFNWEMQWQFENGDTLEQRVSQNDQFQLLDRMHDMANGLTDALLEDAQVERGDMYSAYLDKVLVDFYSAFIGANRQTQSA